MKLLDENDNELPKAQGGRSLINVRNIKIDNLHSKLREGPGQSISVVIRNDMLTNNRQGSDRSGVQREECLVW